MRWPAAVWLVAVRELRARVVTRSFLVITALLVVLSAGSVVAIELLPDLVEEGPARLGLADVTGGPLEAELKASAQSLGVEVDLRPYPDRAQAEAGLRAGDVDALLSGSGDLAFLSKEDPSLKAVVDRALFAGSLPGILSRLGLSFDDVRPLLQPEGANVALLEPGAADDDSERGERILAAQAATIVVFLALVLYGQSLLTGVAEEKTSRVVEVLLGTLPPEQLLAGKVLGILAAAACQIAAATAATATALLVVGAARMPSVALDVALVSCAFLLLGLLSYSFIYAAVGATVSRQSEADSAQMPITLVLCVPYFLSLTALTDDPDGTMARILSLLPPTAPMAMPARVAMGEPSPLEVIAAVVLMLAWFLLVVRVAARLYAGAILAGGPRTGVWRSIRRTLHVRTR